MRIIKLQINPLDSTIDILLNEYRKLNLTEVQDFERFNHYAIVHHSSHIEGSTLTMTDTELLLSDGITPKGKPLAHSLMEKDHYAALLFTLQLAKEKRPLTIVDIQLINSLVNKSAGGIVNTALGTVDVMAGDTYFVNYDKAGPLTKKLVAGINAGLAAAKTQVELLRLSFIAHFDFVTIHPFIDGNGRTTRLLMNYIQARFNLPLAIVFSDDRADYINALKETRAQQDVNIFIAFMEMQCIKLLRMEIEKVTQLNKGNKRKGGVFSLIF